MKRLSHGTTATDGDGDAVLADKWVVPDAPQSAEAPKWPRVEHSYVEFENLNTLGRFSYNKYNREIEVNLFYVQCIKFSLQVLQWGAYMSNGIWCS